MRCPLKSQMVTGNRSRSIDNSGQLTVSTGTPVKYVPEDCWKGALSEVKLVKCRKCRNNLEVNEAGMRVRYGQAFSDMSKGLR